jgi:LysM repeat protein
MALNHGKLRARKSKKFNRIGYLTWHYSVDQYRCVQHLPCNEQAEHADFDGPGNNYSLAIEMCENRGNSRAATLDRTAKLTAWLMYKYKIPLRKVVPHYHWRRKGLSVEHKNCPHFLMDNGHPGAKWQAYLAQINKYYKSITPGGSHVIPQPTRMMPVATTIPRPAPSSSEASHPSRSQSASHSPRSSSLPKGVTRTRSSSRSVATKSRTTKKTTSRSSRSRYHTVRSGDTLYGLSRKYKVSVSSIQRANSLKGTVIRDGKKLRIPAS